MTALQGIGIFAGIPAVILLLIALPFYGGRWYRRLTRRPRTTTPAKERPPAHPDSGHGTC